LLATVHRAENTDDPERLRAIMTALSQLAETEPVICPVHPRTQKALEALGFDLTSVSQPPTAHRPPSTGSLPSTVHRPPSSGLHFIAPLGYLDLVRLSSSARVILTDSGGLQKESFWLGVPCVTLRDETEWVEIVESGWNILAGANTAKITKCVREHSPPSSSQFMGDSQSSATGRIVRLVLDSGPLAEKDTINPLVCSL
jgi:UDP-N-acetylglucosamine 2-epimerase